MPRRRARARAPRRASEWFDSLIDVNVAAAAQVLVDLGQDILEDERKGMTIVRTIIRLAYELSSINTTAIMDLGLALISNDSRAAGSAPDADTADEQPGWWFRDRIVIVGSAEGSQDVLYPQVADIKARRKFPGEDMDPVLILDANAGSAIQVRGIVRLLCLKA